MKAAACLLACTLAAPFAGARAAELALDTVLDSTLRHFPQVLAAVEKTSAQAGRLLAAEGAFDLKLESTTHTRAAGYYDGKIVDTKLVKPLPGFNTKLYGGYRIADGRFPIYEDEFFTNGGGEFKIGAVFSLLRDRDIDERRYGLRDGALALAQTELAQRLTQIDVQHQAANAYLAWLAAGKALSIYRDLLTLAEARQRALEARVADGDLARVYLNENRQYILKRGAKLAEAERVLAHHANRLALYLRDESGLPRRPLVHEIPARWPSLGRLEAGELEAILAATRRLRPEVGLVDADLERERNRLALGENELLTRVDLNFEASQDIGGGSHTREETDAVVRLDVSVPLERRRGRGKIAEARANLSRLEHERRLLDERIEMEVRNIANDIDAAERLLALAGAEVKQAEILEDAERHRFDDGASDFFVVNLREEATADARVRRIEARVGLLRSLTDFYAATVQTARFRIVD